MKGMISAVGAEQQPISTLAFNNMLTERIEAITESLRTKAKEYAPNENGDRMHNFNSAARREGKTPLEVLHGFNVKHLTSFYDILEARKEGAVFSEEFLREKFGDIINYFIIAEAMLIFESRVHRATYGRNQD